MDFRPNEIEARWKQFWEDNKVYQVSNSSDLPKYYVLDMFPYPSGAGLHVGHPLGYIASDIYARYKRLNGFNVLHPMGYDAFGLPAEQYAIQTGVHPEETTQISIVKFRQQLDNMGFSFDWSRQVQTCSPDYYKWTQKIFLMLFEHYYDEGVKKATPISSLIQHFESSGNAGVKATTTQEEQFSAEEWNAMSTVEKDAVLMNYRLAFRKIGYVNWCEELGTVLANDEVKDGVSERGGFPVVQKPMMQWALRITAYAERLLRGLDEVDFSEALKTQQRNWIGRSEGASLFFKVKDSEAQIEVFTTRPDTIFGSTFMVLAPEHELVKQLMSKEQSKEVEDYLEFAKSRSERDRMAEKKISGAFIGAYAINPFNGKEIPIWISEYVLAGYGTGAIMAVPSDDERDERFANHFGLEIIPVVDKSEHANATLDDKVGKMINSDFLDGMEVKEAIRAAIDKAEALKVGSGRINYRLRDANFSRQRYWGEPFPIKFDKDNVAYPEENLPLVLPPLDDFRPTSEGKAPLARAEDWVNADGFVRETDTMPGYAGSSWYFLRYMDAGNKDEMFSKSAVDYWQDVDLYVGGSEHAVGHLMYSRFWHKFFYDLGLVPTNEPYKKLINQGMIQGVVEYLLLDKTEKCFVSADTVEANDDERFARIPVHIDFVEDYGSEKSYLDLDGLLKFKEFYPDYKKFEFRANEAGVWITKSEVGKMSKRYFNVVNPDDVVAEYGADAFRMYEMFLGPLEASKPWDTKGIEGVSKFLRKFWSLFYKDGTSIVSNEAATKDELKVLHTCIKKVRDDVERFSFNTCISGFMVCTNELKKLNCSKKDILEPLVVLIAPFAPFVSEELWHGFGHSTSVHKSSYPVVNESYLKEDTVTYPICINGKKRSVASFSADASKEEIEEEVRNMDDLGKWLDGKSIRKVIVVPKRMVNLVIG